jgi:predicted transcriptional regulator
MQPPIEAQDAISAFFLYKAMAKLSSERQVGEEKVCALDLRRLMGDPRLIHNPAQRVEWGIGVIDVALLGIIRRRHIRDQVPLREIARRLGISRNTVRRYLCAEAIEPAYAERRSSRVIDQYAFQLSAMLKTEVARSRKQRRTLKQIHEDLKELGFEGLMTGSRCSRAWSEGQFDRVNSANKLTAIALPAR